MFQYSSFCEFRAYSDKLGLDQFIIGFDDIGYQSILLTIQNLTINMATITIVTMEKGQVD